ncbi:MULTISPECIES: hypothetical protein [unclassified Methylobacterium]|uniref:hypothetical protein n=1 Tax=unclassified Methylobacterium TaxID=2615210 RepID=UPI00036F1610|nr:MULTISPECIES: hypothetical protein [Methylobacterium]WFT83102.1 hypothetical protein QA634_15250 [Methylobacterium nodulans]
MDWDRYAVCHWQDPCGDGRSFGIGSRTQAFETLSEAILFAVTQDFGEDRTVRISCGGSTYCAADIKRLVERFDFPWDD